MINAYGGFEPQIGPRAVKQALQPQQPQPFNPGPVNPGGVLQGPDGNRYGPTMPPGWKPMMNDNLPAPPPPRHADPNMGQPPRWEMGPPSNTPGTLLPPSANDWMHKYKPIRFDPPPNDGRMHPQVMHPVYSPQDQEAMFRDMMEQQKNLPPQGNVWQGVGFLGNQLAGRRNPTLPQQGSGQWQAILQALGGLKGIF